MFWVVLWEELHSFFIPFLDLFTLVCFWPMFSPLTQGELSKWGLSEVSFLNCSTEVNAVSIWNTMCWSQIRQTSPSLSSKVNQLRKTGVKDAHSALKIFLACCNSWGAASVVAVYLLPHSFSFTLMLSPHSVDTSAESIYSPPAAATHVFTPFKK